MKRKKGKGYFIDIPLAIIIPFISIFMVNMHASMWMMMFIFAFPYVINALPIHFGNFKQEPCCDFIKLIITGIVSFLAGFLNPYGIKAMFYIFSSFTHSPSQIIFPFLSYSFPFPLQRPFLNCPS